MSSARVIFTYKRKRFSSCSGAGHADAGPDFSLDVQVGKDQPTPKEGSENSETDVLGKEVSNSLSSQLNDSCGAKEKVRIQMSVTRNLSELQLCSKASIELSAENKCKTSGKYNSTEALLHDCSNANNNNSCLDLDSSGVLTDQGIQGGVVSRSMEEPDSLSEQGCIGNVVVAKSKLTAPLLTFSRRLKRKIVLEGTVLMGELPTTCKSSCSSGIPSNGDLNVANEAVRRNLSRQSSETMIGDESRGHCPCTRTCANIPVLKHTEARSCSQDDLELDTSPVLGQISVNSSAFDSPSVLKTTNLAENRVVRSSKNETLSCGNADKADEQHASHLAQTSSGGSQLTSSDSSDVKRCAGKMVQQTVSSAPVELSCPATGAYLIDCNVIPESDLQELESDFVQNSSRIKGNCEKIMEEAHLKSEGLNLFEHTDSKVVKSPSSDLARLHTEEQAPFAAETKPKTKCLQLFSDDIQSSPAAQTSKSSETGCCRAQQNVVLTLDGGKEQFEHAQPRASAMIGLSLAIEPMYEGQTSQHGSGAHLFQDHSVGFKEFIQTPMVHSFPDHPSVMLRHKVLLESCNTRATTLRGNRNISLDRFEPSPTMWSEEELDSLWIGIRRYGRGNWHAMLLDPRLRFAPWRVARDLADQWEREQFWLLSGQHKPAGKCAEPSDACNVDSHTHLMYPKGCVARDRVPTETQLSLGDVYARKGRGKSRSRVQRQPHHMHVTVASKLGNYSCSSYATVQTSVMIGDGPPGVGSASNSHIPHWLREPSGSTSRLFDPSREPSPPQMPTQLQTGVFQPVHLYSAPSDSSTGQMNPNAYKPPGTSGASGSSLMRKENKADIPIVIDSDASSEGTISDDHNIRN